ncbi:MAG TPA: ubiquitin-conjugating enzyme E2 [Acidobacteriota bacterium]|nr:ubiquitin-conjugating enzyme E2 [Acidobacteriota bacterium]
MNRKEIRIKNDYEEMLKLKAESSIIDFQANGTPPTRYFLKFNCPGISLDGEGKPTILQEHRCQIVLGAQYPSQPPDVTWQTPIYHPNIKLQAVCHSGQWAPSWSLAEFVSELADMARYVKFNLQSPLDTKAAEWAKKNLHMFPLDSRPIRDKAAKMVIRIKPAEQ